MALMLKFEKQNAIVLPILEIKIHSGTNYSNDDIISVFLSGCHMRNYNASIEISTEYALMTAIHFEYKSEYLDFISRFTLKS